MPILGAAKPQIGTGVLRIKQLVPNIQMPETNDETKIIFYSGKASTLPMLDYRFIASHNDAEKIWFRIDTNIVLNFRMNFWY
ncbi:MAG: hypothetical protein WCL29_00865 [Pseudomonadota bacterium]